jgi:predicted aspartyl protease
MTNWSGNPASSTTQQPNAMLSRRSVLKSLLSGIVLFTSRKTIADGLISEETVRSLDQDKGRVLINIAAEHIYVDVLIKNQPLKFLLDTGAGASVIDSMVLQSLGVSTNGNVAGEGVGGSVQFSSATIPEIRIGDIALSNQDVVVTDLSFLATKLPRADGILGIDFFRRFVIRLDYASSEMMVFDPSSFKYRGRGHHYKIIDDHAFHLSVDGITATFYIDTGSDTVDLFASHFLNTPLMKNLGNLPSISYPAGLGRTDLHVFLAFCHTIRAGDYSLNNVPIRFTEAKEGAFAHKPVAGNVGAPFWRHFITYFNFADNELILESNSDYASNSYAINRAGLSVARRDTQYTVDGVTSKSPAALAGFQKGDILLRINEIVLRNDTKIDEVRAVFQQPAGTLLAIEVQSSKEVRTTRLVLTDFIPFCD